MIKFKSSTEQFSKHLAHHFPQLRHFWVLGRLDRPIGIYLLLWPCLWGLWIAAQGWPGWHLLLVFSIGVVLTRTAGCIVNDLADRKFDGFVERTRERPLVVGQVSVREALLFAACLFLMAFGLVLTTNGLTIALSAVAVIVACAYPYMKRHTYLPQVVLGAAFSFSIPMAFAAVLNQVPQLAWLLFAGALIWTVAYDTEYAMVDRDDDIKIGLKSTAILFGELDRAIIGTLQSIFVASLLLVGYQLEFGAAFLLGVIIASALLVYQQWLIRKRNRGDCFKAFLNNHWVGLAIFLGVMVDYLG